MAPLLPTTTRPNLPQSPAPQRSIVLKIATVAAAAAAAAATVSFTLTAKSAGWGQLVQSSSPAPLFADIAVIFLRSKSVHPSIRAEFMRKCSSNDLLLHVGLVNREGGFGRSSKVYYAFGVYADGNDLKEQLKQYQNFSLFELKKNAELMNDVLERDIRMTVRLKTVEGGLSIRQMSSKILKIVKTRLWNLEGPDKEELQRFLSVLKDEPKILNGSEIELSRKPGHELKINIDGNDVESFHSKLLCESVLRLYVGADALDKEAKDIIQEEIARLLISCQGRKK